jgi:hypothetical protein
MTSCFDKVGNAQGVTLLQLVPAKVVRHEEFPDKRRLIVVEYDLGFKKPVQRGYFVDSFDSYPVGSDFALPQFDVGTKVKVQGTWFSGRHHSARFRRWTCSARKPLSPSPRIRRYAY